MTAGPSTLERKLAAILDADVEGYSRLMGDDEAATVRTRAAYGELIAELVGRHGGRVVDFTGDNLLAEFASVVDAVTAAVEIQRELAARNAELLDRRKMRFRIGINLGDVLVEGGRIFGDGVNVAARVQALAEGGGIAISGTVYDQIENKLRLEYESLGEHAVKNIARPVRVYRVGIDSATTPPPSAEKGRGGKTHLSRAAWLVIAATVIAATLTSYQFVVHPRPFKADVASTARMAFSLPDAPSIAVLPFVNMSEDPKQEFLCDRMTEGIITALSKVPRVLVIARTSSAAYKGKAVKIKQVSEELGVQYVLEGSLQRSGDRVRISAQFIDALTDRHLWAEQYDRELKDVFAMQDEITAKILTGVRVKLGDGAGAGAHASDDRYFAGTRGLECYLKLAEAEGHIYRWTAGDVDLGRRMIEETMTLCPDNPIAYTALGWVYHHEYYLGAGRHPRESYDRAIELAQRALALDDSLPMAHTLLADLYAIDRQSDRAIAEAERALALAPGHAFPLQVYANTLRRAGKTRQAIPVFERVVRLNPLGPPSLYRDFAAALRDVGRLEEALVVSRKAVQLMPDDVFSRLTLTSTYMLMGREKEAQAEAAEILRIDPRFTLDRLAKTIMANMDPAERDQALGRLRRAGLK